jgi:predicted ATPase
LPIPVRDELLEREAETEALATAARAATEGTGRLVVVAGPGGIGKSRLLAYGRSWAKGHGLRVLGARCSELERSFPFGAVRQLLEPLLRSAPTTSLFEGAAALAAPLFEPGSGAPTTPISP